MKVETQLLFVSVSEMAYKRERYIDVDSLVQIDRKTLKIVEDEVYDDITLEDLVEGIGYLECIFHGFPVVDVILYRITWKYTSFHHFELRGKRSEGLHAIYLY